VSADLSSLEGLSLEEKLELLELLEIKDRRKRENWLKHYRPYAKQREFHEAGAHYRERLFMAANQGHPLDFKILTPQGWREVGELKVGDAVIAGDGTESHITGLVDLGVKEIYEVSFDRGNLKVRCTDDHLWSVRSPQRGSWVVLTTAEVAQRKLKPRTPGCGVVQFSHKTLPIHPYLLGLLIGDGSFTQRQVQISSNDDFILDEVRALVSETCEVAQSSGAHRSDWQIRTKHQGQGRRNELIDRLEEIGLQGKRSEHKRVPQPYLHSSPEQRLQMLQGLMDADGSVQEKGRSVRRAFWTSSGGLAQDVAFLCRSLGGHARVQQRGRMSYKHPKTGEVRPCLPGYVVYLRLPDGVNPFRLPRKARVLPQPETRQQTFDHVWDGVRSTGVFAPARCLQISHPSRLYICEGFIVTHNCGKTLSASAEIAMHATGLYPDWWQGKVFKRPTRWIVGSDTAELTRKGLQRNLLGPPEKREEWGTGAIPKSYIKGWTMKPGVPDAVASLTVKNEYGGESVIQFNSYDQGRTRWQADTLDGVALDEEPPIDIYTEALTRTNVVGGPIFITFTPLLGMSQVVKRFLKDKPEGTAVINMTIDDVDHYTPEQRAAIVASYPEHEREARARGIPMMGSGMVFPVAESMVSCEPFPIPPHWARINGMDFGIDHPAAFACLAHDRDTDTVYLYDGWRLKGKTAAEHSMIILAKGYARIPWAWPHDGLHRDKGGTGAQLVKQYKDFGVSTLAERAQFEDTSDGKAGGHSVEAGVSMMLERMQTRRLRVFSTVTEFFEEMRQYHRKDGVIVKEDDDLLSATRYALMMLRKARTANELAELAPKPNLLFGGGMNAPAFGVLDEAAGY